MLDTATHFSSERTPLGSPYAIALGLNVERLRREAHLTKSKFCLMADISRSFLDKIEEGSANPKLSHLEKLAEALGTTPMALLAMPTAKDYRASSKRR